MSPAREAFAILFLGGAAIFVIYAFDRTSAELRRLDGVAQAAGFADDNEMKAATAKGFSQPLAYRDAVKRAADTQRIENERKASVAAKAKAEAEADKQLRQARFEEGAVYAMALKKGMKNPDSFKLESVRRTGDGVRKPRRTEAVG
jgi:hypothetical protein